MSVVARLGLRPLLFGALLTCALGSCGLRGELNGAVYRDGAIAFRIGALPVRWQRVQVSGGQLAFHHAEGGTILAHASCEPRDDASLNVLTKHLLFGIEQRREEAATPLSMDGRQALRTRLIGTLDGVIVALDLVVVKKDGCTYDLELASSPQVFALRDRDFEQFFAGFARISS